MGRRPLKDEKERQLAMRRGAGPPARTASTSTRLSFVVGKDSRDTAAPDPPPAARPLRRPGRGAAPVDDRGARRGPAGGRGPSQATRQKRLADVEAELKRIGVLRDRGRTALAPDLKPAEASGEADRAPARRRCSTRSAACSSAAARATPGAAGAARLQAVLDRLDEPLRVAIAGKVKAGKSTLLNALVGEELAPTDAGECTRIVTWYRDGITYRVDAPARRRRARARCRSPATAAPSTSTSAAPPPTTSTAS